MKNNSQRGFTLIELLVVIAIIGILASVVLASLNTARAKGSDANIKANLANARAQAELYYDAQSPNTYDNVCTKGTADQGIANLVSGAKSQAGDANVQCSDDVSAWAMTAKLKSVDKYYCVDSTGVSREVSAAINSTTYVCPAS